MLEITKITKLKENDDEIKSIEDGFYDSKQFNFYKSKIKIKDLVQFNGLVVVHKDTKEYLTIPVEILETLFDINDRDTRS